MIVILVSALVFGSIGYQTGYKAAISEQVIEPAEPCETSIKLVLDTVESCKELEE